MKRNNDELDLSSMNRDDLMRLLKEKDAVLKDLDAVIQEKDAVIQEKEAVIQEKDAVIQEKNSVIQEIDTCIIKHSIFQYLKQDAKLPTLKQLGSRSGPSIQSNRIDATCLEKEFGLIVKLDEDFIERSKFLASNMFSQCDDFVQYVTKADVAFYVRHVLQDMIQLSQLNCELRFVAGQQMCHWSLVDYWVLSSNGIPIGIIEIKKPGDTFLSNKAEIFIQLFDYMLMVQSFYGVTYVLGILTNYQSWQICWLPHSDPCALAENLEYNNEYRDQTSDIDNRVIHSSKNYKYTDAQTLTIVLCSALKKMKKNLSFYRPRPFLSSERNFIELSEESWARKSSSITKMQFLSFSFPPKQCSKVYLLIDFVPGANGKAWLVCENSVNSGMSVLKFMSNQQNNAVVEKEVKAWRTLGFLNVYSARYNDTPAIVMPVAFTYKDYGEGKPCIDYLKWMISNVNPFDSAPEVEAVPQEDDLRLQEHFRIIPKFRNVFQQLNLKDPVQVLRDCINKCIERKLVHNDIHWRHVGLFPTLLENEEYELISSFIDLGEMESVESEEAATVIMKESFFEITGVSWD